MTEVKKKKPESPLWNLGLNIFLPVAILNWSSKWSFEQAAEAGLILGLVPPIAYGLWDWVKNHNRNGMSLLGILNVLFTGGLAVFTVKPYWFVVKEAFFPFILGLGVLLTEKFSATPFFEKMFRQTEAFDWERVDAKIANDNKTPLLRALMNNCNRLFALSFFISSALNYWLADGIFRKLPPELSLLEQKQLLNEQVAEMMWKGWLVIALPLMGFMLLVFWYFFANIRKLSGLSLEELTQDQKSTDQQ